MAKKNNGKYDSGVNIMGSVPNYNVMLDYISDTYGNTEGSTGAFELILIRSCSSMPLRTKLFRYRRGWSSCFGN